MLGTLLVIALLLLLFGVIGGIAISKFLFFILIVAAVVALFAALSGRSAWRQKTRGYAPTARKGVEVAGARSGGIGLGGILVILGIVLAIIWSFWWGLIIGLVGLIFFGGFVRGRWY
jgi:multisubunit Na+/H+ antiporter MnhF subunit